MKTDSLKWINDTIRNPEDGKPFILYPAETRLFVPSDPEWGAQLMTLASARFVARPNWAAGMKCRWNGYDAVVMDITSTHLHLAWESSTIPVTIPDATAANVNLFLTT